MSGELRQIRVQLKGEWIELQLPDDRLPRFVELLVDYLEAKARAAEPQVGARAVAAYTGLSVPSVYRNAERLGGFRTGEGPRAPWRWRMSDVRAAYDPWPGWGWLR